MSRQLKVTDQVYQDLNQMRGEGETFSHVIVRLLSIVQSLYKVTSILGPSHYLMGEQAPSAREKEVTH